MYEEINVSIIRESYVRPYLLKCNKVNAAKKKKHLRGVYLGYELQIIIRTVCKAAVD